MELRGACVDFGGELRQLALALNLHTSDYGAASTDRRLAVDVHYSPDFRLELPVVEGEGLPAMVIV